MLLADEVRPPCWGEGTLFYGPEDDGRTEADRDIRESEAKSLCHGCLFRLRCLERALVNREQYGVWGGMGEAERKKFRDHLLAEGYANHDMPHGQELVAAMRSFYRSEGREFALNKVAI